MIRFTYMSYVKINGIKTDAGKNIHNANVSHKYFIQHRTFKNAYSS